MYYSDLYHVIQNVANVQLLIQQLFVCSYSKEDGDRDLQMRLAIQNGESSIKEENVHSHDPMPIIERADGTTVNPLEDDKVPSPDLSPPSDRGESPTSSSVEVHSATSGGNPSSVLSETSISDSPPLISSSGIGVSSTPSLHSMSPVDSGTGTIHESLSHHGSTSSVNSGTISSKDSVFTDRSSPIGPSTVARAQSSSPDKADSCLPDSTTSVLSSPFSTTSQNGHLSRTSSGDLGYRSNSSSSLRERLVSGVSSTGYSPMFRTESNASSIVSDNPLSACSSAHSITSGSTLPYAHTPAGMSLNPGFQSQSPFHPPSSSFSSNSVATPTLSGVPSSQQSSAPIGQYDYVQNQPASANGFPMHVDVGSGVNSAPQVPPMNLSNGAPQQQQFVGQNYLPSNGVAGLANALPDWTPAATAVGTSMMSSTPLGYSNSAPRHPQAGVDQLQTMAGPGFGQFMATIPGPMVGPEDVYNPPPVVVPGSSMFVNPPMAGK